MATVALGLLGPGNAPSPVSTAARASTVPAGFQETQVFSALTHPTVVRFAPDGRVFVAEKSGLIKVFDSVTDTTPTTFADLRTNVDDYWDRGLLGMALPADFPVTPYVYVLYTYDHQLGSASPPPRWNDGCPSPPGPTSDGCVVSGRLSRLQASGNVMTGSEQVLVEDWCQQYPSHSVGTVEVGPDGALYASAGDGASFDFADYGQGGNPLNPCGDPPGGVGATLTPPSAEGGALRAQDVRTTGDPTSLDGSIIRVNPSTGAALPDNPLAGSSDPNTRRIIAHGLRNPFRFTFRPGTREIWIGDVGWNEWEEINRILDPTDSAVENFGWPCYEGNPKQSAYDGAGLTLCSTLSPSAVTAPYFAYHHSNKVVSGESCPSGSSSIAGLSFEFAPTVSSFPSQYQGALFFADYSRDCIWVMTKSGNPIPSPGHIDTFVAGAANPVNLEFGPDGNLYYADFDGGTIRRVAPTSPPPSSNAYLSDLTWTTMTNGWGPVEKDTSNGEEPVGDGLPITLNGTVYAKGLGTHAASDVRYFLGGGCSRFKASVGMDDEVGPNGSVSFEAYTDGTKIYDSGVMTGTTPTKAVDVSVAGATELQLVVTNGGDDRNYDHADWALARIECAPGGGGDTTPPTVTSKTPSAGATGVAVTVSPTATFSEAMNPATLTTSTFLLLEQGQTTPNVASVSYDPVSHVATLDPASDLSANTTYIARVLGGPSGVRDSAGNALASDASWTFTTGTSQTVSTYLSDVAWTYMANGFGPVELDRSNGGQAAGDGQPLALNGIVYTKGLGAHAASDVRYDLAANCTRFKASVGVDDEVGANGSVTFEVYGAGTKIYDSGVMTGATATRAVDVAVSGGAELRLVVTNGGDDVNSDHADWASARVECGGGADTTSPTVTGYTPTSGATSVTVTVSPTVTFSEAMDAATLTASTFTLVKQGTTTSVPASVSYDGISRTASVDPTTDLEPSSTYSATVKGGPSGVKDLAGNALVVDFTWSFTTIAGVNQPPVPVIDAPSSTLTWKVGDLISFAGHASDPEQGALPAQALTWTLLLQHCPSNCHTHTIQSWPGVASGSLNAPDHEYPSYLELQLTATDAGGLSASTSVRLDPRTVALTFQSSVPGLQLAVNSASTATPFTRTVIVGSANSVSATSPQVLNATTYEFRSWSDSGAQTHNIVAPGSASTYTATYAIAPPLNTALPAITGTVRVGQVLTVSNGTWTGSLPILFTYQWLRCTTTALSSCTAITGAVAKTYIPTAADVDKRLRARVSGTNAGGTDLATSAATARVKP